MTEWISSRTPEPPHPWANWIANDEWVIISGVVGLAPDFTVPEDAAEQARLALQSAAALLEQAGSSLDEVVVVKPHVTAAEYAPAVDGVIGEFFPKEAPPAGAALTIVGLALPIFKVEFDIWASRGAKRVPFVPGV